MRQPILSHGAVPEVASAGAAAVQVAYRVLSSIYPGQQDYLDTQIVSSLAALPVGYAKSVGIKFGDLVGCKVVDARALDGYDNIVKYVSHGGPECWGPEPLYAAYPADGMSDTAPMLPAPMPDLTG